MSDEDDVPTGCLLAIILSLIIWSLIIAFGWWVYRWGATID